MQGYHNSTDTTINRMQLSHYWLRLTRYTTLHAVPLRFLLHVSLNKDALIVSWRNAVEQLVEIIKFSQKFGVVDGWFPHLPQELLICN
ncbi:hypothetical protein Nepgr_014139 [Nepenthes gracilis]|uniref:Uncharacterized protein n=1 Tax=Nepenthes gracilis TaxID=150966 RepID=A0AAD3XPK8_NEPGR|nr:hypothetical protein Nepgr_014139 [Nepenthes gracilis]